MPTPAARSLLLVSASSACASNPPPPASGRAGARVRVRGDARARASARAAPAPAPAGRRPRRCGAPAEAILADAVQATGGAAAWNAHKTAHFKIETTLQGMGMGGDGRALPDPRRQVADDHGDDRPRAPCAKGTNGKVAWTAGPAAGDPLPRGRRGGAVAHRVVVERRTCTRTSCSRSWRARPSRAPTAPPLECVVATPKLGRAARAAATTPRRTFKCHSQECAQARRETCLFAPSSATGATSAGSRSRSRATPSSARSRCSIGSRAVTLRRADGRQDVRSAQARGTARAAAKKK